MPRRATKGTKTLRQEPGENVRGVAGRPVCLPELGEQRREHSGRAVSVVAGSLVIRPVHRQGGPLIPSNTGSVMGYGAQEHMLSDNSHFSSGADWRDEERGKAGCWRLLLQMTGENAGRQGISCGFGECSWFLGIL